MTASVRLGRVEDFPVNTCHVVALPDGEPVMVINLDGDFHALEGRCSQGGHTLERATIVESEGRVLCPWHGWELDLERGICSANPDCVMKVFPVRISGNEVRIERD